MKATLTLLKDGKMMLSVPYMLFDKLELSEITASLEHITQWGAGKAEVLLIPFECEIIDQRQNEIIYHTVFGPGNMSDKDAQEMRASLDRELRGKGIRIKDV